MRNLRMCVAFVSVMVMSPVAFAQDYGQAYKNVANAAQNLPKVPGVIKKIQSMSGKVTIKHGDIPNLEMPGMTMVFEVADPAMIGTIAVGDRVLFTVIRERGAFIIQWIERQ
jgi:Cu(I)/Ag(I) efflux system periplasmic protein CusF